MRPVQPGRYREALQPRDHGDPPTPHFEARPRKIARKPDSLTHYKPGQHRLNKRRG